MEYREFLAAEDKQFRAHLEEHQKVIGGVLEEVKAQGNEVAQNAAETVRIAGKEALVQAQASLGQVAQAAQKVGDLAQRASEATSKAAQQTGELLGKVDQASQRMVTSEQKVEAALDGLLPKVATIREGLEKELGDVVKATAATEEEIKRMVAAIRSSVMKEIENEVRTNLREATSDVVDRIYGLGAWWDHFTRFGIYVVMGICMVATGILGWYFGRHQVEEGIYARTLAEVKKNAEVRAYAYQFEKQEEGGWKPKIVTLDAPLACTVPGKFMSMTKNENGQWVYGQAVVDPQTLYTAILWDRADKDHSKFVKGDKY